MKESEREKFNMPPRIFLYTLDQIATMLSVDLKVVKNNYIHYDRRSVGARPGDKMLARNLNQDGEKPEWRVAENELIRFLRRRGFRIYERTSISS